MKRPRARPLLPRHYAATARDRMRWLARVFSPRPGRPLPYLPGNDLRLLLNGNEAFSAMLAAILTATESVDIEMYIWRADGIGRRFADLLKAKCAEGVRVRVLYDSVGCFLEPRSFWRELRNAGAEVVEFHPIAPWRARRGGGRERRGWTVNHRDHRKIVVVDGALAYTGGINIGDEYTGDAADPRHWRDTCVEVRGPAVGRLADLFERQWRRATGPPGQPTPAPRPPPAGDEVAIVLASRPWRTNLIRRTLTAAIRRARREVQVTMAYFMPPPRFARALRGAARRGVRVTLIVPARSDVRAVFYAGRSYYAALLRAGVRIYQYRNTVLHAKSVQIDGLWATVGSANIDLRSFRLNYEVNLFVLGRRFAGQLRRTFEADLAGCERIRPRQWARRPWADKLRERFYRLFRFWL